MQAAEATNKMVEELKASNQQLTERVDALVRAVTDLTVVVEALRAAEPAKAKTK